LDKIAAAGTIDIGPSVKHGLDVQLPRELLRIAAKVLATGASTFGLTEIDATTALVVWLHRIEIERRLSAEIDAACGDDGLDDAERERQTREVSAALLECQRDLSELTWLALAENLPVVFSHDWDVRAILGLELVARPTQPAPSSSREHALDVRGQSVRVF